MLARRHLPVVSIDIVITILVSALLALINLRHELISSPDTTTYIRWADLLIGHNFNLKAYYQDNPFVSSTVFYTLPVSIIALLKVVAGEYWKQIFYAINIFALIATVVLFRLSAQLLEIRAVTVAVVLPSFLITTDFIIWPHYLLTDTIFAALVMTSVYATLLATLKRRCYLFPIACCALLLLTRPSAPPVVASILLFLISSRLPLPVVNVKRLAWLSLSAVIVVALVYGAVFEAVLSTPTQSEQLTFIGSMVSKGIVIHDRPDTFIALTPTLLDIARLFLLRLIMFFSPYASTFSTSHIVANCVILLLFLASVIAWFMLPLERSKNTRNSAHFLLVTTLSVAMFQAATLIDFDWRYRFPVIAPMLLFVTMSLDCCAKYVLASHASTGSFSYRHHVRRR